MTYPPTVEQKLEILCRVVGNIPNHSPIYEQCTREVFGPILLQQWVDGIDVQFEVEDFSKLVDLVITNSVVQQMKEDSLIDSIEHPDNGYEMVFLTDKGKQVANKFLN